MIDEEETRKSQSKGTVRAKESRKVASTKICCVFWCPPPPPASLALSISPSPQARLCPYVYEQSSSNVAEDGLE